MALSNGQPEVNETVVRECLDRILSSDPFSGKRAERFRDFLRFVVEETLAGHHDDIKETTIGATVFNKNPDYSTQGDATVRRLAGTVRDKLKEYYDTDRGSSEPIRFRIVKGQYIPEFLSWPPTVIPPQPDIPPAVPVVPGKTGRRWLPSRPQWRKLPLSTRASYVGMVVGVLSLVVGLLSVPFLRSSHSQSKEIAESVPKTQVGVRLWRLHTPTPRDERTKRLIVQPESADGSSILEWIPSSPHSGFDVSPGDRIRFTVSANRRGFLYLVDREIHSDRESNDGVLIFPTARIENGNNEIAPEQAIDIPSVKDNPPFLEVKKGGQTHVGEELTVLLFSKPLANLEVGIQATKISKQTLDVLKSNTVHAIVLDGGGGAVRPDGSHPVQIQKAGQLSYSAPPGWEPSGLSITLNITFRQIQ